MFTLFLYYFIAACVTAVTLCCTIAVTRALRCQNDYRPIGKKTTWNNASPESKAASLAIAEKLSTLIKCQTVSRGPYEPFQEMQEKLKELFPLVSTRLTLEVVEGRNLFYTWKGTELPLICYIPQ